MKSFRLLSIVAGIMALAAFTACQEKEEDPSILVEGEKTVQLTEAQSTGSLKVTSNRDWGVRMDEKAKEWIVVEPSTGKASKTPVDVTITVLANTGANREAAIEFYASTLAREMVTIQQAGPKGDSDGIESITVQEFIGKADKNTYYRLSGTVSAFKTGKSSSGADYMQFNLTDETGTVVVYGFEGGQFEEWAAKIKNNGTVVLRGRYEYYEKNNQHEVVSATVEQFTPGEEQTEITAATVADFIATASTTVYYRLTGTVSAFKTGKNNSGGDYMQFNLTDDTAAILVYGFENGQFEEWSTKIKDNGTVTLVGVYQYYEKNSQHEVVSATIESFTEGEAPEAQAVTVPEAIALADNTPLIIDEATVAGISTMGLVITDGTANAYVYFDTKAGETVPEVAIGDKVKVEATKSTYNGIPEFVKATVTKLSEGEMVYPEAKDITTTAATYEATVSEFVKLSGKLSTSESNGNKYYNLTIPGVSADTKQGSVSGPLPELGLDDLDGQDLTVTGYLTGFASKGKYINILATAIGPANPDVKYCTANPATINVNADATTATFDVTSNADWTVVSDNEAFVVSPASGTGNATVTVTFTANEGDAARVANIKVTCAAAGVEPVVTITQAKAGNPDGPQFTSNVTWTLGEKAYDQNSTGTGQTQSAVINGITVDQMVKLGTSSVDGDFTVTLPEGSKRLCFFALGWKGANAKVTIYNGEAKVAEFSIKSNDGVEKNPPYTITINEEELDSNYYDVAVPDGAKTLKFAAEKRAIFWGINAYTE